MEINDWYACIFIQVLVRSRVVFLFLQKTVHGNLIIQLRHLARIPFPHKKSIPSHKKFFPSQKFFPCGKRMAEKYDAKIKANPSIEKSYEMMWNKNVVLYSIFIAVLLQIRQIVNEHTSAESQKTVDSILDQAL